MPGVEVHIRESKKRYGYDFRELHKWLDLPFYSLGSAHHCERHSAKTTPDLAQKIFWEETPIEKRQYIREAALDHIALDDKEGRACNNPKDIDDARKKWNYMNNDYREFVKKTLFESEKNLDSWGNEEWGLLEHYAKSNTGINPAIVYGGYLYRDAFLGCIKVNVCVKKEGDRQYLDVSCLENCQERASEETNF
jgi:hypothetical protein